MRGVMAQLTRRAMLNGGLVGVVSECEGIRRTIYQGKAEG